MADDITQTQLEVLEFVRSRGEHWTSTKALAEQFHLTARKISENLRELIRWGYRFATNARGEVRFVSAPDLLLPHEIQRGLQTEFMGREIFAFRTVGSTNTTASRYAEKKASEGTLIVAGRQTAGKGRLGRNWMSPANVGIYMSLIVRPQIAPAQAPGLSLIAAVSIAEAIKQQCELPAKIKWPNDVLIDGRKVAGVLTELSAEPDRVEFVVIGIGINANQQAKDFPTELSGKATSLLLERSERVDRVKTVQSVLLHLEKRYRRFTHGGLKDQIADIKQNSSTLSRQISFRYGGEQLTGKAVDIDSDGALVVKCRRRTIRLSSGEITLEGEYAR